ncbi:MAG: NAD(P)-dependent oxidoreductase [Armatimonadetes bacterium]|nr:NAD(P)-dependent oxidoreductase [Armatimonadota bacterium]
MNVLVTGGSGTIGGYVLRELLRAGHVAANFSRTPPLVEGVDHFPGDVGNPDQLQEACRGRQAIVHLAAVPGPGRAAPDRMLEVNVVGTVRVLEAAVRSGVDKVVFASSGAASGFSFQKHEILPRYLPIDEEHPSEPQDEYGLSKLLAELACKRYSAAFGLRTLCLRINHNWYLDREGAALAVRAGWAKGLTVEQLWDRRYRRCIMNPGGEWPAPGPPPPWKLLWAVTDARDAAQAFRLAVENQTLVHEVFAINGSDTCSLVESRQLIAERYPNVPLRAAIEGHASLVSHQKATRLLGYQPQFTWRSGEFRDWTDGVERQARAQAGAWPRTD